MCYRHNWVRNALAAPLNRMPGVQAVLEPMVMTRRGLGDQRRGDIKVVKSGTSFARAHNASSARALTQFQGKAALYDGKKTTTYSDQENLVPFIVGRYQRGRPAIPLQDVAVGGRGHGWTYAGCTGCLH